MITNLRDSLVLCHKGEEYNRSKDVEVCCSTEDKHVDLNNEQLSRITAREQGELRVCWNFSLFAGAPLATPTSREQGELGTVRELDPSSKKINIGA